MVPLEAVHTADSGTTDGEERAVTDGIECQDTLRLRAARIYLDLTLCAVEAGTGSIEIQVGLVVVAVAELMNWGLGHQT